MRERKREGAKNTTKNPSQVGHRPRITLNNKQTHSHLLRISMAGAWGEGPLHKVLPA